MWTQYINQRENRKHIDLRGMKLSLGVGILASSKSPATIRPHSSTGPHTVTAAPSATTKAVSCGVSDIGHQINRSSSKTGRSVAGFKAEIPTVVDESVGFEA